MDKIDGSGGPSKETLEVNDFEAPPDDLVEKIERALMVSLLQGYSHAGPGVELADAGPDDIPFEEALEYMKARVPLTKAEWSDLEPKLRYRAFTVAALSQADGIEKIRQSLLSSIEEGKDYSEFWKEASVIEAAGLGQSSPWYWETVYRTNIQTAYNAGRSMEIMKAQPEYLEMVGVDDERQTDICRSVTGTILPASHPFWKKYWPPLHFGCRTTVRSVFKEEVDAMRKEDPEWKPTQDVPDGGPAKGFGGNPIETGSFWEMTDKMAGRARQYGIMPSITKLAKDLGLNGPRLYNAPDSKDYSAIIPTTKEGGSLTVHSSYGKKIPKESTVGKELAERGYDVKILPRSDLLKSPDLMIDGKVWEVKTPKNISPNGIDQELRDASKQSENVLLNIGESELTATLKAAIKDRVQRNGENRIKQVMVFSKDGPSTYSKADILGW